MFYLKLQILLLLHILELHKRSTRKCCYSNCRTDFKFLNDGAVSNALNFPTLTAEEAPLLKPYIKLSYLLGTFLGQVTSENIKNIRLEMEGKAASLKDEPIIANLLTGILEPNFNAINNVNSEKLQIQKD